MKWHGNLGGTHNSLRWRCHVLESFLEGKCSDSSIVSRSRCAKPLLLDTLHCNRLRQHFKTKEGQIHRSLAETLIVLLEHLHHLSSDAAKTRRDSHGAAAESRQRSGQSDESQVCYFATSWWYCILKWFPLSDWFHFCDEFVVREQAQRDLGEVLDSVSDSLSQSYSTVLVRDFEAIC